jgi:hypothetical protein
MEHRHIIIEKILVLHGGVGFILVSADIFERCSVSSRNGSNIVEKRWLPVFPFSYSSNLSGFAASSNIFESA